MRDLKQASTVQPLCFYMALTAGGPATGLSPSVTLSKNGAAFASPAGVVSEIGSGWYKVAGNATDTSTLGPLLLHATAATANNTDTEWSVVAYNSQVSTNLGLSALPTASPGAAHGLIGFGTGTGELNASSGNAESDLININGSPVSVDMNGFLVISPVGLATSDQASTIINSLPSSGTGAYTIIQPVVTSLGAVMQNVWVTLTLSGVPYSALTDSAGHATFRLNAGTYSTAAAYPFYFFTSGSAVVTTNATLSSLVGTAVSITPPTNPTDCAVYFIAHHDGAVLADTVFTFICVAAPTGSGNGYFNDTRTATSDATGLVTVDLPQSSVWKCRAPGEGGQVSITVPASSSYQVPNFRV